MSRRPARRTPAQTLAHLIERRRLAAATLDHSQTRIDAIDAAIAAIRDGRGIPEGIDELEPIPGIDDLDEEGAA